MEMNETTRAHIWIHGAFNSDSEAQHGTGQHSIAVLGRGRRFE
jgi:hypothetical protein